MKRVRRASRLPGIRPNLTLTFNANARRRLDQVLSARTTVLALRRRRVHVGPAAAQLSARPSRPARVRDPARGTFDDVSAAMPPVPRRLRLCLCPRLPFSLPYWPHRCPAPSPRALCPPPPCGSVGCRTGARARENVRPRALRAHAAPSSSEACPAMPTRTSANANLPGGEENKLLETRHGAPSPRRAGGTEFALALEA